MPTTSDSKYRDNRRIGSGAPRLPNAGGASFQPRFGAALALFGQEVTLGPEHVVALAVIGVMGGVEAAMAAVVLALGYLFLTANSTQQDTTGHAGGQAKPTRRAWKDREPGVLGALKYVFGPLPEGPVFSADESATESVEAIGAKVPRQPMPAKPAPAAPAAETAADRARSAAAREAAAKRAMARAAEAHPGS